ncbi:hypothetical protein Q9L58_001246 [Maublancomyces gigas]|uniref:Uncharacterized protein n=1 Tax=Discina gigas TaxID=1032678 RepID=A0ABR3GUQ9_9PEZI
MAFATKSLVSTKSFNLRYNFLPMVSLNASIARNVYHPLHAKTIERQKEEERPQLIIDIVSTIKRTSPKAVVRNRSKRRVREATYQVLKENGYGRDGKAENGGKKDLVGTLAFFTTTETVLTPWEELKAEVRYGVGKWIVLRQRGEKIEGAGRDIKDKNLGEEEREGIVEEEEEEEEEEKDIKGEKDRNLGGEKREGVGEDIKGEEERDMKDRNLGEEEEEEEEEKDPKGEQDRNPAGEKRERAGEDIKREEEYIRGEQAKE